MGNINREWHEKNKITNCKGEDEQMIWRIEHMKNCDCRTPSTKQLAKIRKWKSTHKI